MKKVLSTYLKPYYGRMLMGIVIKFIGTVMDLFLPWILVAVVVIAVRQNKGFEYSGLLIYAMALYAFYSIITAVINVVKFRKYGSLIVSAAKVINLTVALVSMLSLETAMSAEVGGEEINLTTREFNILYKLLSYPKKTFSRAQLMDEFWGGGQRYKPPGGGCLCDKAAGQIIGL